MKTIILRTLVISAFLLIGNGIIAQPPPPPSDHGGSGNAPAGGGGSLTGGIGILMALGAAYGGRKVYKAFKNQDELES
jgi:hypothetical protein